MQNPKLIFFASLLLLALTAAAVSASATANPNPPGVLAFAAERPGASGIYLLSSDGVETRLTREIYDATHPAWSPNGASIAFNARVNGREEIFVMQADGSNVRVLTKNQGNNYYPSWSPDSRQLAIASDRDGLIQVFLMNADGTNPRVLTDGKSRAEKPAWSPDGTEIAVMLLDGNNAEVYAIRADGSSSRRLTNHRANDFNPAWSPDGSQIAFNSSRGGDHELYAMHADGSNVRQLTNASGWSERPVWSPDGSHIAFYSNRDGNPEIYSMSADGSNVQRLTNNSTFDGQPTWQPIALPSAQPTPVAAPTALPYTGWKYPVFVLDSMDGRLLTELHAVEASDLTSHSVLTLRYTPSLTFSADGKNLLVLDTYLERGTRGDAHDVLSVFDATTLDLLQDDVPVTDRLHYKIFPAGDSWFFSSPDGKYLFIAKYGKPDASQLRLAALDVNNYESLAEYPMPQCEGMQLHVLADSRLLCLRGGDLLTIDPLTGAESLLGNVTPAERAATALSPDREKLYLLDADNHLTVVALDTISPTILLDDLRLDTPPAHTPNNFGQFLVSPDGSRLYVGFAPTSGDLFGSGQSDLIRIYDAATGKLRNDLEPTVPASYLALSRDGKQLYLTNHQARVFALYDAHTLDELGSIQDFGISPSQILVPPQ